MTNAGGTGTPSPSIRAIPHALPPSTSFPWVTDPSSASTAIGLLRPPGEGLVLPVTTQQPDELLVQLEPHRVVAVDDRPQEEGVVPGVDLVQRVREPARVGLKARRERDEPVHERREIRVQ